MNFQITIFVSSVSSKKSSLLSVFCGVSQGSILGPTLYIMYINDLAQNSALLTPILLADNKNLLFQQKPHIAIDELSQELDNSSVVCCE